jgi:hypothetical protein
MTDEKPKTLGQIAFEVARPYGVSFVAWDEQSDRYRHGWEVATQAVAAETQARCPLCGKSSKSLGIISQDSLPPMLTHLFQCVDGHQWSIGWEGL